MSPASDQRISSILWILQLLLLDELEAGGRDVRSILEITLDYDRGDVRFVGNVAVVPETKRIVT